METETLFLRSLNKETKDVLPIKAFYLFYWNIKIKALQCNLCLKSLITLSARSVKNTPPGL